MEASRIFLEKVGDPKLAIKTLDDGWPNHLQAKECVRKGFEIRGRLGYHDLAEEQLIQLASDAEQLKRYADIAELLTDVFARYPESRICKQASALARKVIANRMEEASRSEVERLVRSLARLAPHDKLLMRDGRKFANKRFALKSKRSKIQKYSSSQSPGKLNLLERNELGSDVDWISATSIDNVIYVAGVIEKRVALAQCGKSIPIQKKMSCWPNVSVPTDVALLLVGTRSPLRIFVVGEPPLPEAIVFSTSDNSQQKGSVSAKTPRGHGVVWGAALGTLEQTWAVENRDDPVLICVDPQGNVVSSQSLFECDEFDWQDANFPLPMYATQNRVLLGIGKDLVCFKNNQFEKLESFATPIRSIGGMPPYAAAIFTVALEVGAAWCRLGLETYIRPFATELDSPLTLINSGSFIVVADENRVELYKSEGKTFQEKLILRGTSEHATGRPIALLSMPQTDQFAMVTSRGSVSIYSL